MNWNFVYQLQTASPLPFRRREGRVRGGSRLPITNRVSRRAALLCPWLLIFTAGAWQPVKLVPYPQKFRTFYSLTDTNVPAAVLIDPTPLPFGNLTTTL